MMRNALTEAEVVALLERVVDPQLERSIVELGMVRGVVAKRRRVQVSVALPAPGYPGRRELHDTISSALTEGGAEKAVIDFTTMTDQERGVLKQRLVGMEPTSPQDVFTSTRVIAVGSGKGGVGKSSVSANLAIALSRRGKRTIIIDADVYGFSIPRMLGVEDRPLIVEDMILPPKAHGVSVISIGFFSDEANPVIWRGPMLHKALTQFVTDVYWGTPDIAIIDMPPGTGDVALSMSQFLPASEVIVVTTPQVAAQRVAQRSAYMARKVKLSVTGVIENMSWFTGNDGERYEIFGSGGGGLLAQELGVPLLGQVPLVPALREGGDVGAPIVVTEPDSEASLAIDTIAAELLKIAPPRIRLPLAGSR
jgi:ATP-binding protein involved in chromosome partitioning